MINSQAQALLRLAQAVLLLKLAVALIVFDPSAVDTFVLPKSAIGHTLSVGLVGLIALCVWSRAVVLGWSWVLAWVAALTASFAISTPFALDTTVALFGVDRRFVGFTHVADAFVIFIGVSMLFRTRRDLGLLLGAVIGATLVVVGYGLLQMSGHDVVAYTEGTLRPIATIGQQDTMGAYAGIAAITSLTFVGHFWRSLSRIGRAALIATAASCFVVGYGAGARSSLLALAAGTVAALVLYLASSSRRLTRWQVALVALLIVGSGVVLASPLASRVTPDKLASDPSLASRLRIWEAGMRMVVARPLLGVGPDNFAVAYPAARTDATVQLDGLDLTQTSAHSWPVYVLTSAGLLGGLALGAALIAAVIGAVRLRREGNAAAFALIPLLAYLGQGLVTITDPSLDWVAWASLGVIAANTTRPWRFDRAPIVPRLAVVVALGCLIFLIPTVADARARIGASEAAGRSEHLLGLNRPLDAVTAAGEATRLDARRAVYWGRFGTALSAAGGPSGAQAAYVEAGLREPWQSVWRRDAALQWLALGNAVKATDALREAVRIDPHDAISIDLLARLALNAGDLASAAAYGDRAVVLYPGRVSFYDAAVAAHERRGEWDIAERELRQALEHASEPQQPQLHLSLASLYEATGRRADARSELTWLLAHAPDDPAVAALKARLASQ